MNILHYSLGPSPYRSGGLTLYCEDLMREQVIEGNKVALLYPAGLSLLSNKMRIVESYDKDISFFRIDNPLPVSLYHGVKDPKYFYSEKGYQEDTFEKLLDKFMPNVVHIHTVMGLPLNFLKLLHRKNIRIIYTTHDYFGLCLKTNFIDNTKHLCSNPSADRCAACNQAARSLFFLRFRNEPLVIALKNKLNRSLWSKEVSVNNMMVKKDIYHSINSSEYKRLLDYYDEIFSYIDLFHFNSTITKKVYSKYLTGINGYVIPITNSGIKDHRCIKRFGDTLKICFIGSLDVFKGFPFFKSILLELKERNWSLDVWGSIEGKDSDCDKIHYRGIYNHSQIKDIYDTCDLVIVPSQWYETFSFVTLEALSFGTPVIVSDHVGAQDIVKDYDVNFVFSTKNQLKQLLSQLLVDKSPLIQFNHNILRKKWTHDFKSHAKEIMKLFYL